MALAQDKADQTAADTQRVRLMASGASASDIKTQADLIAYKDRDMANILKVNPTVVAAAGAAANADPALVQKAITNLVSNATTQSSAAVQLTSQQVQAALTAVQQLKSAATTTTAATTAVTGSGADAAAMLTNLTKTASTYSIKSLSTDTAAKPASATTTQVASTSPAVTVANPTTTQVANSPATSPAANAVTAPATTTGPVAAPVDKSEMTPAVVQMLLGSGDSVITAMKAAQQAAIAKGDTATADGLGKDIVNLQAQIAVAKTMPPPAATTTNANTAAAAATTSPATTTSPAATTSTQQNVAAINPTTPATNAATSTAATNGATAATSTAKPTETAKTTDTPAPTKITAEQGKQVQQALRTVPGKLSRSDEKTLSALSTLVDRAATKGLTPDEAAQLKSGLAALAEKHPKAEKQIGLTKIANSVVIHTPAKGGAENRPAANPPLEGKVAVTNPPLPHARAIRTLQGSLRLSHR